MAKVIITRLVEYPWPVVRLGCRFCPLHQPSYRLVRLAARLGDGASLDDVLDRLACSLGRPRKLRKMQQFCGVFFCDLHHDLPEGGNLKAPEVRWFDTDEVLLVPRTKIMHL